VLVRFDTNNMYRKSIYRQRLERKQARARLATAARERDRLARAEVAGQWPVVGMFCLVVTAAPDGRHAGLQVIGREEHYIAGTHRALVSRLGNMIDEAIARKRSRRT